MQYRTSPRFPAILSSFILFLSTDVNRIIYVVPEFFLQFLYSICFSADFPRIIYTNINTCFTSGASACLRKHFSILNRNRTLWAFFHTCSTSCTSLLYICDQRIFHYISPCFSQRLQVDWKQLLTFFPQAITAAFQTPVIDHSPLQRSIIIRQIFRAVFLTEFAVFP